MSSTDQVDEWEAVIRMKLRRASSHPLIEVAVVEFQLALDRLWKELHTTRGSKPTYGEDLDRMLRERIEAIRTGRTGQ